MALCRDLSGNDHHETIHGDAQLISPPSPNLIASVRQRLLNHSREQGQDFNLTLTRYGIERLLYRLAQSAHGSQFVLKGAMLFVIWAGQTWRPTRDLDLAGYGDSSPERLQQVFTEICAAEVEPDGLVFDATTIRIEDIREVQAYPGYRIRLRAWLGQAEIPLQIDIGFGDAMIPAPAEVEYPTLLKMPSPRLRIYPKETVLAEKVQAMVALGLVNSRMKDYYDVWLMTRQFGFEGSVVVEAIQATFSRRQTELPSDIPVALTARFGQEPEKQKQWQAFWKRSRLEMEPPGLNEIIDQVACFFEAPLTAAAKNQNLEQNWLPGGPWQ
jgi:predicted nucleotidyltransferase component of viral defense system